MTKRIGHQLPIQSIILSYNKSLYAEWGDEEESDIYDKELWYQTNLLLGQSVRLRMRLGQMLLILISSGWVYGLSIIRNRRLHLEIKYGKDGQNVSMSIAVNLLSRRIFVEAIDC